MHRSLSSAASATPSNRSLHPSFYRFFHTGPQHFSLCNSIPTARALFLVTTPPWLLHSSYNAIVQTTLRGASRLGRRRKALQSSVGGRYSGFAVTQTLPAAPAREIAADGGSGIRNPVGSCIAPWQQGCCSRDGRGVGREPPATDQSPRSPLDAQTPRFPQRRRERVTTRSTLHG